MLSLLLTLPDSVEQSLAKGETSVRVVASICKGTSEAHVERVSKYADGMWTIWLYRRDNLTGTKEAGIVYEAGPKYDQGDFPGEVLRFFSKDEECYKVAVSHYEDLFAEHNLIPLGIVKNVRLLD